MKKFLITIISLILVAALGFGIYWSVVNFSTVKDTLDGANIYTQADVDAAYNDGYGEGNKNEESHLKELEGYKSLVNSLKDEIVKLEGNITSLSSQVDTLQGLCDSKDATISSLNDDITALNASIAQKEETIAFQEEQIIRLEKELGNLDPGDLTYAELEEQVATLYSEKYALEAEVDRLNIELSTVQTELEDVTEERDYLLDVKASLDSELDFTNNSIIALREQLIELGYTPVA